MVNPESKRHAGLASAISLGLRGHSTRLGRRPNDRQRNEAVLLEARTDEQSPPETPPSWLIRLLI